MTADDTYDPLNLLQRDIQENEKRIASTTDPKGKANAEARIAGVKAAIVRRDRD